jgi:hypothetical protein
LSDALLVTPRVSYFRDVTRSRVSALVKEAMAMRSSGHLLRRAGREFVKNLLWMGVVFGLLAAVLVVATNLPLVGTMAFVGVFVAVAAAVVTVVVIWSGAYDERTRLGGHNYPGSPPDRGDGPGGGWESVDAGGGRQPSERSDALRRQARRR